MDFDYQKQWPKTLFCPDHEDFNIRCHTCLLVSVFRLAARVEVLEMAQPTRTIYHSHRYSEECDEHCRRE